MRNHCIYKVWAIWWFETIVFIRRSGFGVSGRSEVASCGNLPFLTSRSLGRSEFGVRGRSAFGVQCRGRKLWEPPVPDFVVAWALGVRCPRSLVGSEWILTNLLFVHLNPHLPAHLSPARRLWEPFSTPSCVHFPHCLNTCMFQLLLPHCSLCV